MIVFISGCTAATVKKVPDLNTLTYSKKMILEETDRYKIDVETINIDETETVNSKIINTSLLQGYQIFVDLFKKNQAEVDPMANNKHALSIESTPLVYNEDLISIELSAYEYLGGAHPNTYKTGITYSVKEDLWLMPSDLANTESGLKEILNIFSEEARLQISFNYPGTDLDEEWLKEGTEPTELNFFDFTLTPEGILLYIPTYQVAPYAVGAFEVPIKYSQVKEWITDQAILHYISKLEQ